MSNTTHTEENLEVESTAQTDNLEGESENLAIESEGKSETSESEGKEKNIEDVTTEDNLELHNMKFKDRMKAKRERFNKNTEGMSTGQKIGYFIYYYKGKVFLFAVLLFLIITIPITIYNKTRPVSISYAIINCAEPGNINTSVFEDYRNYYVFEEPNQIVEDKDVSLNLEDYNENTIHSASSTDYSQFPMLCHNNYYDVAFTDFAGIEFCAQESVVLTLEAGLPADLYDIIKEEYSDLILEVPNYNGDMTPYAIDITNTDFAKELNLGYSPVYICFPGNSERNISNAKKMVDYILNLGLDL